MSLILTICALLLSFTFYGNAAPAPSTPTAPPVPPKSNEKIAGKGTSWWQPSEEADIAPGDDSDDSDSDSSDEEDDETNTDDDSEDNSDDSNGY